MIAPAIGKSMFQFIQAAISKQDLQEGEPPEGDVTAIFRAGCPCFDLRQPAFLDHDRREAEVRPFLDDMEARFAGADLVLSRSGATTCAELTAAGRAAILVPFARAADDHQRTNARALAAAGAARVVEERDLPGGALAREIGELVAAPERLAAMEEAARRLGRPDAAARVSDLLLGEAPEAGRV